MILGIDLGTSKVAAVILDEAGELRAARSAGHGAEVDAGAGRYEQEPEKIAAAARLLVRDLPAELRAQVRAIGVSGQMHGMMLVDGAQRPVANLITWQDGRCSEQNFLQALAHRTGYTLSTGFGMASLAWLGVHGELPETAEQGCTLQDWFVARLTGRRALTDPTDGASWGFFDLKTLKWDWGAIQAAGVDPKLVPEVLPCGTAAGNLTAQAAAELGVPARVPVAVAIGDNQASLLATLQNPETELALTLGTGGQLSAVRPAGTPIDFPRRPARFEYRPFPGGRYALVASALCGGSAWNWLADTAAGWLQDLGGQAPPREELFERLNRLGLAATRTFILNPNFLGERIAPEIRGTMAGLTLENFSLGELARSLARGIAWNLKSMLPDDIVSRRQRVVGSGNALRQNELLRVMAQELFGLPLLLSPYQEEAACGAALLAKNIT